ncbi:hypothetical protein [Sphaerisporangium album]|uniref:hypothetical protein n=1 Tax=Sphaerisporangium album TaxID=509200 RepID=UPI0011C0572B|nr:hypothetical protein [Sphaerisporangium album]
MNKILRILATRSASAALVVLALEAEVVAALTDTPAVYGLAAALALLAGVALGHRTFCGKCGNQIDQHNQHA